MSFLYEFFFVFFFFKQKTAYEMRISDWSSDVCSSDLQRSKRDDVDGVDRLKHRCRYFIAQYISVHLPIGVQVDRRSRLLKARPEENGTQNQEHGGKDHVPIMRRSTRHSRGKHINHKYRTGIAPT